MKIEKRKKQEKEYKIKILFKSNLSFELDFKSSYYLSAYIKIRQSINSFDDICVIKIYEYIEDLCIYKLISDIINSSNKEELKKRFDIMFNNIFKGEN